MCRKRTTRGVSPRARIARHDLVQDVRQAVACRGLEQLQAEGRADADHDIAGRCPGQRPRPDCDTGCGVASSFSCIASERSTSFWSSTSRMALSSLAPLLGHAIAGAGTEIVVGIIDRADDLAVADHRRGLQIVARNPELHDIEQVLRLFAEAAPGQRLDHVDHGDAAVLDRLADEGHVPRHEARGLVRARSHGHALLHLGRSAAPAPVPRRPRTRPSMARLRRSSARSSGSGVSPPSASKSRCSTR